MNKYMEDNFDVYQKWHYEDVLKHLYPKDKVLYSYVVANEKGEVTDFVSFYLLPSTVLKHDKYDKLNSAYAYYTIPGANTIKDLYRDALILAKNEDCDVFNCLDIMENGSVFSDLQFGPGDGSLYYYLYNWRTPAVGPERVGMILV